ncbi:hypothetical protein [Mycobacterium sp.]|uniref:hypothetical protein n=1 Tax=Mycobacterium sp. TaxID=1785 RepID=UPI003A8B3645
MDVVLRVVVAGPVARLVLVDAAASGDGPIDQYTVDLADNPVEALVQTVAGTNRLLGADGHRLVGTWLAVEDANLADQLRQALEYGGVANVQVVAVAADATRVAPVVGGDATAAVSTSGTGHCGAGDEELAYSQSEDVVSPAADDDALAEYAGDYDAGYDGDYDGEYDTDYDTGFDDDPGAPAGGLGLKRLLISNAVVAFTVLGFASLAVAVAVTVRPTAASMPVEGHQNAQPGKFMPLLPTEQQAPVPLPPAGVPNAGFQGGTVPIVQGVAPRQEVPVPVPVAPAPVPIPLPAPLPVPVIVPFPGWLPGMPTVPIVKPPVPLPTVKPTTQPPTTKPPTTQPPTTTAKPTTQPPTTTAKPTTQPPTTQPTIQPTTRAPTQAPTTEPITQAPATATIQPTTVAPTTAAPVPSAAAPVPTPAPTQPPTQAPPAAAPQTQAPRPAAPKPPPQPAPKPPSDLDGLVGLSS